MAQTKPWSRHVPVMLWHLLAFFGLTRRASSPPAAGISCGGVRTPAFGVGAAAATGEARTQADTSTSRINDVVVVVAAANVDVRWAMMFEVGVFGGRRIRMGAGKQVSEKCAEAEALQVRGLKVHNNTDNDCAEAEQT